MKSKNNLLYKNRFVLFSFFASMATMLIIYAVTQLVPFGGNTILRMDLYHQYGPLFSELYDKLTAGDLSVYSWKSGLGSSFLGNYFNYLSSPIGAIVVFFGHKHVPEAIATMILIKTSIASATFTYYLKKSQKNQSAATVMFGIMYAFCAYVLAYYWNVMWLDAVMLLPIVLLGIERIIDNGKPWIYIGALSLTMFSNYYMSFMLCIFAVIYFIYYYVISNKTGAVLSEKYKNSHKKKLKYLRRNSKFYRSAVIFAGASVLSALLISFALLPTYEVLQNCSATSSGFPHESKFYFNFFDFFANHLPSLETTIRSSGDDVIPNVYCGLLTVILAPLYFFTKTISKKEKIATLSLLGFLYISFNINYLNFYWHAMHFPNDLPYRFSFMYSFILLVIAYKTFVRLNEFTSRQIALVGSAILAFCFFIDKVGSKNADKATIFITLILCVLYIVMLTVLKDKKYEKSFVATLLCIFVICEVIVSDTRSFPNTVTAESYESDYSEFTKIKDHLDTIEDGDFYRMELSYLRTRMDPSWFGYNGASIFSSMAYEKLSNLQNRLGMMSNDINSYTYNPQTPVYNMMHSIKYVVNNKTPNVLNSRYYKHIKTIDKYEAYENRFCLPIAFGVNSDIKNWDYQEKTYQREVNPFDVQGDFFDKATGMGNPFEEIPISFISYSGIDQFDEDISSNAFRFNKQTADGDGSCTFYYTTQKAGNVYIFYNIEGGNSKDVTITSSLGTITHSTGQDSLLDLGAYKEGETVSVSIPFEENSGTVRVYAYTMNNKIFKKGYEKLSESVLNVTKMEGNAIDGTFVSKNNCTLFTSIPYDEGWHIYVDSVRVPAKDYLKIGGGFIGINLEKGQHKIQMRYHAPGLAAGVFFTVIGLIILLIYILKTLLSKRSKKALKKPAFPPVNKKYTEYVIKPLPKPQPKIEPIKTGRDIERILITPPKASSEVKRQIIVPTTPSPFEVTEEETENN